MSAISPKMHAIRVGCSRRRYPTRRPQPCPLRRFCACDAKTGGWFPLLIRRRHDENKYHDDLAACCRGIKFAWGHKCVARVRDRPTRPGIPLSAAASAAAIGTAAATNATAIGVAARTSAAAIGAAAATSAPAVGAATRASATAVVAAATATLTIADVSATGPGAMSAHALGLCPPP
jgi:hypothetical protein